ncbi:MAG: dihydroorotase [Candidatus Aramenus sp.]|nr:dihydroorotase [Candidatus Aramenus sp.]
MWIKGKLYLGEVVEGCVEFDRKIKSIKKECKPDLYYPDSIILPGSIDMHVHVRGMQLSYKETVATATSEAVYGGVTVVVDMPNTQPYINTHERVLERIREFENFSRTDFGVYSGVTSDARVDGDPIAGYKVFPEDLEKPELEMVLSSNKLKVLHPELPISNKVLRESRLLWQEIASLYLVRGKVHVTHATSLETIRLAKSLGFTTDVTPHHLLLEERDCMTKVNPPLRDKTERNKLLRALFEVDAVVSDHAPHTAKEKELPFEICPPGIAGVSFVTPFVYTLFKKGVLSLERTVELVSKNQARILGIKAGEIKEGYVANFTVISFNTWRYSTKFSKVTQTPFDGYPLEAKVTATIVEGKVAYDGETVYPIRGMNLFDKTEKP